MTRRILDWDLCMMTILDLLAQPQSSIPLLRVDLITALYMSNLYSMDRRDFFFPINQLISFVFKSIYFLFWRCVLSNLTCNRSVVLNILLLLFEV
jgi:hypothetical protein